MAKTAKTPVFFIATKAHHDDGFDARIRKTEKEGLAIFKKTLGLDIDLKLASNEYFPSDGEVFIFIVQYFGAEKEYGRRDVDNMAKTILDVLKNRFYHDDRNKHLSIAWEVFI